jgi:hypothetical protein
MARSTAEIQADIALTRHAIEAHLDALQARIPRRWWTPCAVVGGAFAAGFLFAQMPVLRILVLMGVGARTLHKGVSLAKTLAATQRQVGDWVRARNERLPSAEPNSEGASTAPSEASPRRQVAPAKPALEHAAPGGAVGSHALSGPRA